MNRSRSSPSEIPSSLTSVFGNGLPVNWVVADILRIKDDVLAEHWDVIQNEATKDESKTGMPMFGDEFAERSSAVKQGGG